MDRFVCWKCGASLQALQPPLGRNDICPSCRAELYVCRMCTFFDPKVSNSCREPIADEVKEKERVNFCGYFQARPDAYQPQNAGLAKAAWTQLDDLFGGDAGKAQEDDAAVSSEADIAREQLERLFGGKDKGDA